MFTIRWIKNYKYQIKKQGVIILDTSELFWNASVEEMKNGYIYDSKSGSYICLICGKHFEDGIIYQEDKVFYEAKKYIEVHIKKEHSSMFEYLLNINKKYTGLTDHQKALLLSLKKGLTDKEIASDFGQTSPSTIRNHRFKLREREKQAKVFLAIMSSISEKQTDINTKSDNSKLIEIHKNATMIDDRYAITEDERTKTLETYFNSDGSLKRFPTKEKKKIVVLQHIAHCFNANKKYTEKEVNTILSRIFDDFATIRRYLIEYGFMERYDDCSYYWINS